MSSADPSSIGIMEGAFFVPRSDLLNWVNSTLELSLTRIQQLGTGAVYCQLTDVMFPGRLPMQRVNWKARNEWQFINNYKILQQGFVKCKINKHIDIEKLSKSKYQDNLQFIQWMKRYFDLVYKGNLGDNYNAKMARKNADVDFSFVAIRNPVKSRARQSATLTKEDRRKHSKSPSSIVKPMIKNRSSTTAKYKKKTENNYYLAKLKQINDIIKKQKQDQTKIQKIEQILQQIYEELPSVCQIEEQIKNLEIQHTIDKNVVISQNHTPRKNQPVSTKRKRKTER